MLTKTGDKIRMMEVLKKYYDFINNRLNLIDVNYK